ncbi:helix-hairpin-helix domain-containing protein [Sulfurospirillum arcachonense]|uniref:helix-hairpin-helix domain-containing protein n=1 Tax=Sulfurospirillum arcachonense TaxID=57666 RepID=UPI00046A4324|nr:Tex-like N-terminal domain-containing protein [Sulfurospirillum arcachonense]
MQNIIEILKTKTDLSENCIKNIINLLEDGCTIAFIARYRKDMTNNASDEVLLKFQEVYEYSLKLLKRKEEIANTLKEKGALTPKLQELLDKAITLTSLEDIYEPYKGVKSTRADDAIKNGLEGLANIIMSMRYSIEEIYDKAKGFLNNNVKNIDEAIQGAQDIIALRYSQELRTKDALRKNLLNHGLLVTKKTKTFEENGLYKELANVKQKASYIKSHKILAILRAVNEKQISLKVEADEDYLISGIKQYRIPKHANNSKELVLSAYIDGLKRLLLPSLKRELLSALKQKASDDAINLFGKNLNELLITPPLVNQVILGIDPGFKTGCKLAVIDKDGAYLDSNVMYLLSETSKASKIVLDFIKKYKVSAIAIGNGTGSKEAANFIANLIKENKLAVKYAVVSEIGASVYSASKIANEEYGFLDVTIRGAISIAGRLRDPMATLVKIDPKSLGIGQYQHDVNQSDLAKKLNDVTFSLVNRVGVDLNSASYKLLSFVSGISEKLAKNIVAYREEIKGFTCKKELLHVKGVGAKAYEQSVGFLRIKNGKSFLDNSGIHPENYDVAKHLKENFDLTQVTEDILHKLSYEFDCGVESLKDILQELKKPGYDIREELEEISFCEDIKSIEELKEGDIVSGVVRNITDFGAFIDIGLKNDALLHISEYSHKRISHLMDVMSINQQFKNLRILNIDLEKNRVSISLKDSF